MDFKTRDLYRKEIESLSFATGREENELAEITLDLARKNSSLDDSRAHVGPVLAGERPGRVGERIGYHPNVKTALKRWGFRHANILYLGSIISIAILTSCFWCS